MAKARTTEKSTRSSSGTTKASTAKGKSDSKAPKAAAKPAADNGTAKAAPKPATTESAEMFGRGIPGPNEVKAHPDAKLNKGEVGSLYQKLIDERNRVLSGFDRHVAEALEEGDVLADEIDIAQRSTDQAWLFRFADKERKLLIEIDAALDKLRTGDYGLCEGTDEPIGFKRLELRPWTRYSVAYKEQIERERSQHRRERLLRAAGPLQIRVPGGQ